MKLSEFFSYILKFGIQNDPRVDKKSIKNYSDTAILYGNPNTQIKNILVGIDIEAAEIILADRLKEKQNIDLVLGHHPEGIAYANLYDVMPLQIDVLKKKGVNQDISTGFLKERKREVARRLLPQNHNRAVDAARLLDIPFVCAHTPADNHVYSYLNKLMNKQSPKKISDVIDLLNGITEYKMAVEYGIGPKILIGNLKKNSGKILVDMTGGTEGHKDIYKSLSKAGISTLICMHLSDEHLKNAFLAKLNVIVAGHISSDNLGMNLLLDNIEKKETLNIISCSGFTRIKRS